MDMFSGLVGNVTNKTTSLMSNVSQWTQNSALAKSPLLGAAAERFSGAAAAAGAGKGAASAEKEEEDEDGDEKKDGEKKGDEKEYMGRLEFKLDYSFEKNTLTVTVIQAEQLPAMDLGGTSDPYVRVCVLPDKKKKFQTKVVKKSLNPVYNETFVFPKIAFSDIPGKTLVFDVYDYDQFGANDQIGEVHVPLGSIDLAEITQIWRDIKQPSEDVLGDICLSLRYVPQKSQLTVVVMECKNLKKMDITGGSDPYVKLNLMHNGKRLKKQKTSIKMNNLNPYFNESFKFEVSPNIIQRVQLDIFIMDYDRVGSNDAIGHVLFGVNVGGGSPQRHWMDMINSPRRSIAQWHSLLPAEEEEDEKDKKDAKKK